MNDKLAAAYQESQHELYQALMAVEWSASEAGPEWDECPWCRNYRRDGHRADCQRQLALGLAETLDGAIAKG